MPTFHVFEVQEEVIIRKSLFVVEADSEDDAVEKAMNGQVDPIEQGTVGEPEYTNWGWSARPADAPDDDTAWGEAVADLEERRLV